MNTSPELLDREAAELSAALGAQYELVRLIGKGGMGRVYLARERFLDRDVAVKVLPAELAEGADARERFLREARTAARLSHANIVPLYTFGQSEHLLYFVMGYVAGESLETCLRREGRLEFDVARRILAEIADALEYAHAAGIVHRDLKPDNVLIDGATGRALLADFGIAKQQTSGESLTRTGMLVGTPHYMSPEQASGDKTLDGRSDIYALGVMGYRMLGGRLPFEGDSVQEVLTQHLVHQAIPIEQLAPEIPLDLSNAIGRAMSKEPSQRFPSARIMRDGLTGDSDEAIPDELRSILGSGIVMTGLGLSLGALACIGGIYGFLDPLSVGIIAGVGLVTPAVGALAMVPAAKRFGLRAALNAWMRQPTWWSAWWPRSGRRPGDLWDRIPRAVKLLRNIGAGMTLSVLAVVPLLMYGLRPTVFATLPRFVTLYLPIIIAGPFYVGTIFIAWRFARWAKQHSISSVDRQRLITEPTFRRSFWMRPDIARLLTQSTVPRPSFQPVATPASIQRDLEELAMRESRSPHAALFREAADGAALVRAEVERIEDELAKLAHDADAQERARIRASLDALGEPSADERAEKRELRTLFARQLAIFAELETRRSDLSARRQRLLEHLNLLVLQVARLRGQAADQEVAAISGEIRSLCREIDARQLGVNEVKRLLAVD